jgi:hypothetical protein
MIKQTWMSKLYAKARDEGRLCSSCGWIISTKNWKKGYRLCGSCWDANKGVRTPARWGKFRDEPLDMTGEML